MIIRDTQLDIINDDITRLHVDAIVNPVDMDLCIGPEFDNDVIKNAIMEIKNRDSLSLADTIVTPVVNMPYKLIITVIVFDRAGYTNDIIIRQACANVLRCAKQQEISSLAIPAIGCYNSQFSVVGSAKIMTQEVLKFVRVNPSHIEKIYFCIGEKSIYDIFLSTITGYIRHFRDDLGAGPFVTVDAIIEYGDGIILIERSNPPYGWALPGGFLDYGESLEEAVVREAKEETNLCLKDIKQFHTYSDPERDPRFHTVSTVFIAKGEGDLKAGDDAKGVKVVSFKDLLSLDYAFDHKKIIQDYLSSTKS